MFVMSAFSIRYAKMALLIMTSKDFSKRMGLSDIDPAEVRERFLNRIRVSLFRWLEDGERTIFFNENFIWWISEQMGEPWGDQVHPRQYGPGHYSDLTIEKMAAGDFYKTLEIVEKCYQYVQEGRALEIGGHRFGYHDEKLITLENFEQRMQRIMLLAEADLGVFWKDGKFYPSGAKELDRALIEDPLEWLADHPLTQKQFLVALGHYERSLQSVDAGKDAITNCYTSVERLAQEILKNDKSFDKNSDALVDALGLPKEYKNIVHYYKSIANEYGSRHAGSNPLPAEVEAFVYLTGLLLRLMAHPGQEGMDESA